MQELAQKHPELIQKLSQQRPLLQRIAQGRDSIEVELDAERRKMKRAEETRLLAYAEAAKLWTQAWPTVKREIAGLPLRQAHSIVVERARLLPQKVL